ncbi:MAG: T9SS type A sorting domain-containing protein [Bacteroidetes bacterium]|nr:T9SS type A sorting domain-containing protein [Bacteroidota bacterium]
MARSLASTCTAISTYSIGNLLPGVYTYTFKCVANGAFNSTMTCIPADSNQVSGTFTVDLSNGITESKKEEIFIISPNPFCDKLTVRSALTGDLHIEISDATGRIVFIDELKGNETNMLLSNLSKGMYFLRIRNPKEERVYKVIKE